MEGMAALKTLGQLAGIGGIALGVLLLIFRDVIRRNIFPNLQQGQSYRLITLVVVLTFAISALGVWAWVYVQRSPAIGDRMVEFPSDNPEPVMLAYLSLIDEGKYEQAYFDASAETKRRMQRDLFVKAFSSQRSPQGRPRVRSLYGISTFRKLPDDTVGAFANGIFITEFASGKTFLEYVTLIAEDGNWKMLFHYLGPCQPGICEPFSTASK